MLCSKKRLDGLRVDETEKMTAVIRATRLLPLISFVIMLNSVATSQVVAPGSCKAMADDKQRLRCFDLLFGVPAKPQNAPEGAQTNWSVVRWLICAGPRIASPRTMAAKGSGCARGDAGVARSCLNHAGVETSLRRSSHEPAVLAR